MMVLVTYDVSTTSEEGRRRLTKVAKTCLNYGQRAQNSVFECKVTPAQWVELKAKLEETIDPAWDSLRFYFLGKNWRKRVEHIGAKPVIDPDDLLIL